MYELDAFEINVMKIDIRSVNGIWYASMLMNGGEQRNASNEIYR